MLELFLKEIETKNGNSVRIISLNNNRITDSGFALLTSVIPRLPNLRILYLSKLHCAYRILENNLQT